MNTILSINDNILTMKSQNNNEIYAYVELWTFHISNFGQNYHHILVAFEF